MSKRILGLDLGTNSIGWSVVDSLGHGSFELKEKGVHVFPMGVKLEKGSESSKASERTGHRAARRLKFRRKLRKIETLKVLSGYGYCPELSLEALKSWQSQKIYPSNQSFRQWCSTSDPKNGENGVYDNPYYYRWLAATEELDIEKEADRFKIGRAFYHIAQRRGFKSNRKDTSSEDAVGDMRDMIADMLDAEFQNVKVLAEIVVGAFPEDKDELKKVRPLLTALKKSIKNVAAVDEALAALKLVLNKRENLGVVKGDIVDLNEKKGDRTLGQYFFEDCYKRGKRIRNIHTSRDEHYLSEVEFICKKQGISEELKKQLIRAIFFQRPLKSQKGLVANCPFEPKKKRAPISYPLFEEFRMWQTLNNIKIKTMDDQVLRDLSSEEKEVIIPLFLRVKDSFDFKDIAKKLTPRGQKSGYIRRDEGENVLFNYKRQSDNSGMPFFGKTQESFWTGFQTITF